MMFPVFEKLGGEIATLELIANKRGGSIRAGEIPSSFSIKRWKMYGIPGWVQSILADECSRRGIACTFDDMKWHSSRKRRETA